VLVDGFPVTNPRSRPKPGAVVQIRRPATLRGRAKLLAALDGFRVDVTRRVCLDVGAAAGGFTSVLVERGAQRVYAVDAGHGQLAGSLRQHSAVVNLEATNLGDLDTRLVPETVEVVTVDVSYLALAAAIPQLDAVQLGDTAELVALVKPMFELRLPEPPDPADGHAHREAVERVTEAAQANGWTVQATMPSPVTGARGAKEHLVHAVRLS
jgi:23S rRNA (cytidine1920-2'-O)/16S rRNA (cytidine1409-2'-O)-methyltransferase